MEKRMLVRKTPSQFTVVSICFITVAVCAATFAQRAALAQVRGGRPGGRTDVKQQQHEMDGREAMLRNAATRPVAAPVDQKRITAAIEQLKEDFRQIQVVRNEMVRAILAEKPFDYRLIADRASDVNKRADRLKKYLIPGETEEKENKPKNQEDLNEAEIKGALVQLCNRIASFVDNPVLKTPGITDVEQSTRAGGDLLTIIDLSSNIRRNAERMSKLPR